MNLSTCTRLCIRQPVITAYQRSRKQMDCHLEQHSYLALHVHFTLHARFADVVEK